MSWYTIWDGDDSETFCCYCDKPLGHKIDASCGLPLRSDTRELCTCNDGKPRLMNLFGSSGKQFPDTGTPRHYPDELSWMKCCDKWASKHGSNRSRDQ